MMSADSGARTHGVEGEHARGQDEQAEEQAGIDAGLDEWERIVGELEEEDEQPQKETTFKKRHKNSYDSKHHKKET